MELREKLSLRGRGPEHGQLRQIINLDAETTSWKPPKEEA